LYLVNSCLMRWIAVSVTSIMVSSLIIVNLD
jgi:hypothetical protein